MYFRLQQLLLSVPAVYYLVFTVYLPFLNRDTYLLDLTSLEPTVKTNTKSET